MIFAQEASHEWFSHTLTAIGGVVGGIITAGLLFWGQFNKIWGQFNKLRAERDTQQQKLEADAQRDDYEMDKIRRTDAYQELLRTVEQLKKDRDTDREESRRSAEAMNLKLAELQSRELDCLRKSAKQDAEIYKQAEIIKYLEMRVKNLEASFAPPSPITPSQGAALAGAVKEVAKEAIAESKAETKGN